MPIYQYACEQCGNQLEALQKMSDPVLVECPACGQPSLRKQVTAAAFRLKGTGWYETDFKNSGSEPTKKATANHTKPATDAPKSSAANSSAESGASSATTA